MKVSGIIKFNQKQNKTTEELGSLDNEIETVKIDPDDPASIEAAIQSMEAIIDKRLGPYSGNSIIAPFAKSIKIKYRESIVNRAATDRIKIFY